MHTFLGNYQKILQTKNKNNNHEKEKHGTKKGGL